MSALDPDLQAHLDGGTTTLSWCWLVVRTDGTRFGFTDHDEDIIFGGDTFASQTALEASEIRANSDLAVDAQDATGALTSDSITETDILDGLWDDAMVWVYRVNWSDPSQRALRRKGSIGQIRRGQRSFVAEVRSLTHILGQTVGRLYQAGCDAQVGDSRCGVNLHTPTYEGDGTVTSAEGRVFAASGLGAYASDWFTAGVLTWATGANAGRVVEVATHVEDDGDVTLWLLDLPVLAVEAGDTFTVTAGCNKAMGEGGCTKFSNWANFRGFPSIPGQETMMRYASTGDGSDGAVL